MRVICPSCATEYEVPQAWLAGRARKLKCARCGETWQDAGLAFLPPGERAPAPSPPVGLPEEAAAWEPTPELKPEPARTQIAESMMEAEPVLSPPPAAFDSADILQQAPRLSARRSDARQISEIAATEDNASFTSALSPADIKPKRNAAPVKVLLLILLLVGLVILSHKLIEKILPASAKLFTALGMH